jgi:hypothetical protein
LRKEACSWTVMMLLVTGSGLTLRVVSGQIKALVDSIFILNIVFKKRDMKKLYNLRFSQFYIMNSFT